MKNTKKQDETVVRVSLRRVINHGRLYFPVNSLSVWRVHAALITQRR